MPTRSSARKLESPQVRIGDQEVARAPGFDSAGRAFLTDFGLAKSVATGSKLTRTGEALGTPAYMSPEQARGEVSFLTPATDVWSLGCVLYELLAGRSPFPGETAAAIVGRVLLAEPARIRVFRGDVPAGVERVLRAALAKRARSRYAEAGRLREDLDRLLRGERPRARPPAPMVRLGLLAVLGVAAGLGAVTARWPRPATRPDPAVGPSLGSQGASLATRARAVRASDPVLGASLLAQAIAADPSSRDLASWRIERGLLLWSVGRRDEAAAEWRRVPEGDPESAAARLYDGLASFFAMDWTGSGAPLKRAADAPGPTGRVARGTLRAGAHDWAGARLELHDVPGWEAALVRGFVESGDPSGDLPQAVREYETGLSAGFPFAYAWTNLGAARFRAGDIRGALDALDRGIQLDPRDPLAWANRGRVHHAAGSLANAIEDFSAAARLAPEDSEAVYDRGVARHDNGDPQGALADLDLAIRLAPECAPAWSRRGSVRADLGDLQGAIRDQTRAIEIAPSYVPAWMQRGAAREEAGDREGASMDYSECIRLKPHFPEPYFNRARIQAATGNVAGAIADIERCLARAPEGWPHRDRTEAVLARLRAQGGSPR